MRAWDRHSIHSHASTRIWLDRRDDFLFDNHVNPQILYHGVRIGEITCRVTDFDEAPSIDFKRSPKYGLGVLGLSFQLFLQKRG